MTSRQPARLDVRRSRADRRAAGMYFTPPHIAEALVRETLAPWLATAPLPCDLPRVLDPACGDGGLLLMALEQLTPVALRHFQAEAAAGRTWPAMHLIESAPDGAARLSLAGREYLARQSLLGIDRDAEAVRVARRRLAEVVAVSEADPALVTRIEARIADTIRCADALLDPIALPPVDAIVSNPPFVNIRQLSRTYSAESKQRLRQRFASASGSYDLYPLFLEQAQAWLKPGGRAGFLVPNKFATLGYAAPCRALLAGGATIEQIIDLTHERGFADANVYPWLLVWRNEPPADGHHVRVHDALADARPRMLAQAALDSRQGWSLAARLEVEARVPTVPLAAVASIHTGCTGFAARRLAQALVDDEQGSELAADPFITSGNIDRYEIRHDGVRFMQRRFRRPRLRRDEPFLSPHKRRLYAAPKIVLAGLSRRLEAALACKPTALGVQVFALTDWKLDPCYLLGLLNSRLVSYLFAQRFAAKQLAGGYLAVNKPQLAALPIRQIATDGDACRAEQLVRLVKNRLAIDRADHAMRQDLDERIDQLVYQLYQLTDDEIADIEATVAAESGAAV